MSNVMPLLLVLSLFFAACSSEVTDLKGDAGSDADAGTKTQDLKNSDITEPKKDTSTNSDSGTITLPTSSTCLERSEDIRTRPATIVVSPAANGQVNVNGTLKTLRQVVSDAQPGDVIALEDGTYLIPEAGEGAYSGLYFTKENITLRSVSGKRDAVILDSAYSVHGGQSAVISIDAPGVILADFTVKRSIFHLIHIWANGDGAEIHNVVLQDGGQQFLKSSPGNNASVDDVDVTCSAFLMTDDGRDNVWGYGPQDGGTKCYTGGIDTHDSKNWRVTDNYFEGIYCDASGVQRPAHGKAADVRNGETYNGGLAEHAVHMWDSPDGSAHRIERNKIVNCGRGIGIGLVADVYGVKVLNNMIFSEHPASGQHDVGINIDRGHNISVINNSVYFSSPDAYPNAIEFRYDVSSGLEIRNNLTNQRVFARNGAEATLSNNLSEAESAWFVDAESGDLHLSNCEVAELVGAGIFHDEVTVDIDNESRAGSNDIGADQCSK